MIMIVATICISESKRCLYKSIEKDERTAKIQDIVIIDWCLVELPHMWPGMEHRDWSWRDVVFRVTLSSSSISSSLVSIGVTTLTFASSTSKQWNDKHQYQVSKMIDSKYMHNGVVDKMHCIIEAIFWKQKYRGMNIVKK